METTTKQLLKKLNENYEKCIICKEMKNMKNQNVLFNLKELKQVVNYTYLMENLFNIKLDNRSRIQTMDDYCNNHIVNMWLMNILIETVEGYVYFEYDLDSNFINCYYFNYKNILKIS